MTTELKNFAFVPLSDEGTGNDGVPDDSGEELEDGDVDGLPKEAEDEEDGADDLGVE